MKLLTLERALWLAAIIALLITMRHCSNRGASTAKALTDSLRLAEKRARDSQAIRTFEYNNNMQVAAYRAKQARDSAATAWAKATALQAQIRALLGRKMPQAVFLPGKLPDGIRPAQLPNNIGAGVMECCALAGQLADQVDVLRVADSLKDAASNEQITLATNMVNAQGKLLDEAHRRFDLLDSAYLTLEERSRLRGSVWGGVETQVGPVSSAGVYLKYQSKGGKEYGVSAGRQPNGWYGGVKVGIKFSFRKKR